MPAASAIRHDRPVGGDHLHAVGAFARGHRRALSLGVAAAAIAAFVVFVLPQIEGLSGTLQRLRDADPAWMGAGLLLEAISLASYGLLFLTVFSCHPVRLGPREAFQITLAGSVASKLLSTAGAGGVALTVWVLRAAGLSAAAIARRMLAFEVLLYGVFAATITVVGIGLRGGILPGEAPWTLTVVPAIVGAAIIIVALLVSRLPRGPRPLREAMRIAVNLVRARRVGALGAIGYWGFDIGALWASLHAFGTPPPLATIVMAYFVGQLGNTLPLPGGIGGVEGGMIGALIAFGTPGSLAILGVLAYRLISFWLPTIPGGIAYVRLRSTVAHWRADDTVSALGDERDVAFAVGHDGAARDMADRAAGRAAADRVGERAALGGDEQITCADAGGDERAVWETQHKVVPWVTVAGRAAVGEQGVGDARGDKPGALDTDVRTVRKSGRADASRPTVRRDRVDPSAALVGRDQVAGKPTKAPRGDDDAPFDPGRVSGDHPHAAAAVDRVDRRA